MSRDRYTYLSTSTNGNGTGTGAIWKWLMGVLLTVALGFGSYAFARADARLTNLEDARIPHAATEATLQTEVAALKEAVREFKMTVDALNSRLDRLAQRESQPSSPSPSR